MSWPQISDLIGIRESPIAKLYRVLGVLSSWLLDYDGRVIARELRHGKLDELFQPQ